VGRQERGYEEKKWGGGSKEPEEKGRGEDMEGGKGEWEEGWGG